MRHTFNRKRKKTTGKSGGAFTVGYPEFGFKVDDHTSQIFDDGYYKEMEEVTTNLHRWLVETKNADIFKLFYDRYGIEQLARFRDIIVEVVVCKEKENVDRLLSEDINAETK